MARNMRAAGVARVVPAWRATAAHLRATADNVLADQAMATRVRDISRQMIESGGANSATMHIEDLLGRQ